MTLTLTPTFSLTWLELYREARAPLNRTLDKLKALKGKKAAYLATIEDPEEPDKDTLQTFSDQEAELTKVKENYNEKIEKYRVQKAKASKASQRGIELKGMGMRI